MKVTREEYLIMKAYLSKVIKAYHFDKLKYNDLVVGDFFSLWHIVYANVRYSDENRNVLFVDGKRLFERNDDFEYYPCDTNDDTLLTALRKVTKEILG